MIRTGNGNNSGFIDDNVDFGLVEQCGQLEFNVERRVAVDHVLDLIDDPSSLLVITRDLVQMLAEQDVVRQDVVLQHGSQTLFSEGREQEEDELFGKLAECFIGRDECGDGGGSDENGVLGLVALALGKFVADGTFTADLLDGAGESREFGGEEEGGVEDRGRRDQGLGDGVQVSVLGLDVGLGDRGVEVELEG